MTNDKDARFDLVSWSRLTSLSQLHGHNSWLVGEVALSATSPKKLKARDHCNLRALIGRKGGNRPSSLHTRRWRSKGPKKTSWMKSLHGGLWIRFHDLQKFSPPRGGPDANSWRPRLNFFSFSQRTNFKTDFKAVSITYSRTDKLRKDILLNW